MEYTNDLLLTKRKKGDMLYRFVRKNKVITWCIVTIGIFSIVNFYLIFKFFELLRMI